jgi:hypothetical protein
MAKIRAKSKAAGSPAAGPPAGAIVNRVGATVDIPLALLEEAPWNAEIKRPIAGEYRLGLIASLQTFGLDEGLKVWPDPATPGRYKIIDGNQRKPILAEFGLDPCPCRIRDDLSREQAILYTAARDRNHAAYDEAGLAVVAARDLAGASQALVRRMLRADVPLVPPPPRQDLERVREAAKVEAADVVKVFSFTAEGAEELDESLVGFGHRLKRSAMLSEALRALADRDLMDVEAELALRILAARRNTQKS